MLAHDLKRGRICWREAEREEAAVEADRPDTTTAVIAAIVQIWQNDPSEGGGQSAGQAKNPLSGTPAGMVDAVYHNLMEAEGISLRTARRKVADTEKKGFVRRSGGHGGRTNEKAVSGTLSIVAVTEKATPLMESLYGI
jgi:hypothetical protein